MYGKGRGQAKKGRKNFWGLVCGKRGIVLLGEKESNSRPKSYASPVVSADSRTGLLLSPVTYVQLEHNVMIQ